MAQGKLRKSKADATMERRIVGAMLTSDDFARQIIGSGFNPFLLKSTAARTVSMWAQDFITEYEEAPKEHIFQIYESKLERGEIEESDDGRDIIGVFLKSVKKEMEHTRSHNVPFLLDRAENYFNKIAVEQVIKLVKEHSDGGNVQEAVEEILKFRKSEIRSLKGCSPLKSDDIVDKAFEKMTSPDLIRFKGALGEFFNGLLKRTDFVTLMGPEKRGKTWWLIEMLGAALRARLNVAYISVGDMEEEEVIMRTIGRASRRPWSKKYEGDILWPVLDCYKNQCGVCDKPFRTCKKPLFKNSDDTTLPDWGDRPKNYVPCVECHKKGGGLEKEWVGAHWYEMRTVKALEKEDAREWRRKLARRMLGREYKLLCVPNGDIDIAGIDRQLDLWFAMEGFECDVLICDYMDNVDHGSVYKEFRHQENYKWRMARRMAQQRKLLFITVTQSDAASMTAKTITVENFSEDKRKFAHVTAGVSINQTPEEKRSGIYRLAPLVARNEYFDVGKQVRVLQCLKASSPHIASYW